MTYKWFHNEILQPAETTNRLDYFADFESAGLHQFDIEIENGVGKETFSWNLTVTISIACGHRFILPRTRPANPGER